MFTVIQILVSIPISLTIVALRIAMIPDFRTPNASADGSYVRARIVQTKTNDTLTLWPRNVGRAMSVA